MVDRFSSATIIGAALTIVVVLAIFIYGVIRVNPVGESPAALANASALNPAPTLLRVGQKAPDFTLRDAAGRSYSLASQRGHPVLLEFFAVWCPVCHAEAPTIARVTMEYVPQGVRVWSVLANPYGRNYDISSRTDLSPATRQDLNWYAQTYNVHHPQLVDPNFATVNRYGVNSYPGIYVVNEKGIITFAASGRQPASKLNAALDKALGPGSMG